MRLGICGKATSAAWICISWAKSLSKVRSCRTLKNCSFFRAVTWRLELTDRQPFMWYLNAVWFEDQAEQSDSCILHSRTEHLNPIVKKKKNSLTTVRFCGNGLLIVLCLWSVSSHLLSPCSSPPWMTKKIPFLISSDRAWPRLPRDGCMVAWWGLLRPRAGIHHREEKGATSTKTLATMQQDATWGTFSGCWASAPLLQMAIW